MPPSQANSSSAQQQSSSNAGDTAQPTSTAGTGLFGSQQNQQQQQQQQPGSSSLFGGQQNQAQQSSTSLFGGQQNQAQQGSTSLFGNQQNQPQQGSSSLFGGQQNQQQQNTSSLFGGGQQNQQQQTSSLFSGGQQNQPQQNTSSLFGRVQNPAQQPTSSLFGGQPQNQQQQGTGSLFGGQQNQQQQQPTSSLFGLTAAQPTFNQPTSLLGASQYRASQYPPFAGKLTMGQQSSAAAGGGASGNAAGGAGAGSSAQGAVQINFDTMRPTTRFNDCIPDIQAGLEKMDAMIAAQERFCREIEAFIPKHGDNVRSLKPDVELVTEKVGAAEDALSIDAQAVESEKAVLAKDGKDGERVRRVIDNLRQPREFHYSGFNQSRSNNAADSADGSAVKDMDLIGNYFVPLTSSLQHTLNAYSNNLAEIEQHLRIVEGSAVAQAQQLAAKRAGVRTDLSQNEDETVRELAETLRGFETSILGAASQVGQCREGLNELVLGRLGR
jgi:nucleoporin p58/p45